jgi:flagellin
VNDADMAKESAAVAKGQVLMQASAAVLAQANATPQYALMFLQ